MGRRFRSRDQTHLDCEFLKKILIKFDGNFAPNSGKIQGSLPLRRTVPPNSGEDEQKKEKIFIAYWW